MNIYDNNLIILKRLKEIIDNSPTANFQKILYLAGITDMFELDINGELEIVTGGWVEETSEETIERMNAINN